MSFCLDSQNNKMDKAIQKIIKKLKKSGFTAYITGGAVRDLILGVPPKDFDVATDAVPEKIEKIFQDTRPVGKNFGVILVVENNQPIEVATFRSDVNYSDNRRPNKVTWSSAREDALRRDFTINALFLDLNLKKDLKSRIEILEITQKVNHLLALTNIGTIIDYVGGLNDIEKKYLKFVGDAQKRIDEDHLRIMRAIRFKSELNLHYFEDTFLILKNNAEKIHTVSTERLRDELDKILASPNRAKAIKEMDELMILKIFIPEIEPLKDISQSKKFFQAGNIFNHTELVLSHLPKKVDVDLVWAALLHDIGKPKTLSMGYDRKKRWTEKFHNHNVIGAEMAREILKRLKFPNDRIEKICWLIDNHQMPPQILTMRIGRQKRWLLDSRLPDLLILHKADAQGKEKKVYLGWHDQVKQLMEAELQKPPPPPRLLDGNEIMRKFNLQPSPQIGRLLNIVEDAVWDNKISTKKEALAMIKNEIQKETKENLNSFLITYLNSQHKLLNLNKKKTKKIEKIAFDLQNAFNNLSPGFNQLLGYVSSELLDNISDHSQASAVEIRYHSNQSLIFLIADNGITFKGSLNDKIEKAIQGKSSKKEKTRGFGLPSIKALLNRYQGQMIIISGNDRYALNTSFSHLENKVYSGTVVAISLPREIEYNEKEFYKLISL